MILRQYLICAIAAASSLVAAADVTVSWLNPTHSFGAFKEENGAVTCTFIGINTGTDSLVVLDARANCGCTRPDYSRAAVAPGDTVKIAVSFDPHGRPGRFDKQVKIITNATNSPSVLHVRGTVIGKATTLRARFPVEVGAVRISNDICPLGQTFKGHVLASAINIYNASDDTIRPRLTYLPKALNAVFKPEVLPPGEQGILSLTAYTSRVPEWGLVTDSIVLVPDGGAPQEHQVTIGTTMIVNEDFSALTPGEREAAPAARVNPGTLDFADIRGDSRNVTLELSISNVGKSTLHVRRIYSTCPALSFSSVPSSVASGKVKKVKVTLDASLLPPDAELLNERITLITDSPANSNLIIRAVGRIIK